MSSAIVENCADSEFVLFTDVAKFNNWIKREIQDTQQSNTFASVFDSFDQNPHVISLKETAHENEIFADCLFEPTG